MHKGKLAKAFALPPVARTLVRISWCVVGVVAGVSAALWYLHPDSGPAYLVAPLGGSAVFLFGMTRAPAAQPRALFGGHLGATAIGILCTQAFGVAPWVHVLALILAFVYMLATRTVHPPAGADPLIMVHTHAGFSALLQPIGAGILILASVAFVWSRMLPGTFRYPYDWRARSPETPTWGSWKD
jgi:CBS-domain-containing membrane protein